MLRGYGYSHYAHFITILTHDKRFRWVGLQIQALCSPQMKTTKVVKQALGKLPKTLEESYDVVYQQMLDTDPDAVRKSETAIRWLLFAKRQLRTKEFIAAVCASFFDADDISSDTDDEQLSVDEILDICCNLVNPPSDQ